MRRIAGYGLLDHKGMKTF